MATALLLLRRRPLSLAAPISSPITRRPKISLISSPHPKSSNPSLFCSSTIPPHSHPLDNDDDEDRPKSATDSSSNTRSYMICSVINDLFASDRNMEAVLDECTAGFTITPSLVVDVLERFRHAHKPAFRFFRWAATRPGFSHDAETYNKMLSVLGKTRQFESVVALLEEMGKEGMLSLESFRISIKAFAGARQMKKCLGMFQLMKRFDFDAGVETFNFLIMALAKERLAREAQELFDKMSSQYRPDLQTYTVLLLGWCRDKNLLEASRVWNEMNDKGFELDVVVHNIMLDGLIRAQRKPEAIKFFENMKEKGPKPNARTFTIMIQELCKRGKMNHAMDCFKEMLATECQPDVVTYTCLIMGFGNARQMDKVSGLLAEMVDRGCPPDSQTYNALIKLMVTRAMPDGAARIYKKMIEKGFKPTIHTYNMMMKSYFNRNDYEKGCTLWEEMCCEGVCPDVNSYTVFIGGQLRCGRLEEAHKYLEEMMSKGMRAPEIDFNKFAADFSKVGKPDILYELAQKMNLSGKFEESNVFHRMAEKMKNNVKRRVPHQTGNRLF